jgi:signal transduction histidine kinase/ActR/RegA family two-component response regulator
MNATGDRVRTLATLTSSGNWVFLALPMAMVFVGLASLASTLVFRMFLGNADDLREAQAYGLALISVGLAVGGVTWWHRQRDALGSGRAAERLNGFHAVMSQTNRLILRRPNPCELLDGVCRVCVDAGHMDLAVVDMLDAREVHRATADVSAEGVMTTSPQLLLEGARLQTLMTTLVVHTGRCVVVDDATIDDRLTEANAWCLAKGLLSFAAVPLRRGGVLVGILLLCSPTKSFFGEKVTPLLSELGADLSFALDNAERERERHSALLADHARLTAEDANRAKTEFLAQMSHELRTPLNAMLGFAQLLATDKVEALSTTQAERVRLITHAGWHLLGLVNDVMDISRIESRRFEVTNVGSDISSVLDEAVALTQPLARANQVSLSEQAPSQFGIGAVADPRRLLQVLLNLLSNACKYNRPGGRVRVEVTHAGAEVILDVVDDGVGMTKEHLAHLFEPFNRLGNEGNAIEGSGIGLTLTRQLVELMNGRLEIESSPESGTRARLVLPSCAIPLKVSAEDSGYRARELRDAAVILYIEDDPVNRILVEQMLLRCDEVKLLLAESGKDGIAMARRHKPDLVLLDMHLPDMSGLEVLSALRSDTRTEALPVVAVSANAMSVDVAKAFEHGAVDYWTKPLKLDAFLAGVSAHLGVSVPDHWADSEGPLRSYATS